MILFKEKIEMEKRNLEKYIPIIFPSNFFHVGSVSIRVPELPLTHCQME